MTIINLLKDIALLEEWLAIPEGAIPPFREGEEQWVFVLKATATVESVLKSAIVKKMSGEPSRRGGLGGLGGVIVEPETEPPYRETIMRLPLRGEPGA